VSSYQGITCQMRSWSVIAYAISAAKATSPTGITMRSKVLSMSPPEPARSKKRASAETRERASRVGAEAARSAARARAGR